MNRLRDMFQDTLFFVSYRELTQAVELTPGGTCTRSGTCSGPSVQPPRACSPWHADRVSTASACLDRPERGQEREKKDEEEGQKETKMEGERGKGQERKDEQGMSKSTREMSKRRATVQKGKEEETEKNCSERRGSVEDPRKGTEKDPRQTKKARDSRKMNDAIQPLFCKSFFIKKALPFVCTHLAPFTSRDCQPVHCHGTLTTTNTVKRQATTMRPARSSFH